MHPEAPNPFPSKTCPLARTRHALFSIVKHNFTELALAGLHEFLARLHWSKRAPMRESASSLPGRAVCAGLHEFLARLHLSKRAPMHGAHLPCPERAVAGLHAFLARLHLSKRAPMRGAHLPCPERALAGLHAFLARLHLSKRAPMRGGASSVPGGRLRGYIRSEIGLVRAIRTRQRPSIPPHRGRSCLHDRRTLAPMYSNQNAQRPSKRVV